MTEATTDSLRGGRLRAHLAASARTLARSAVTVARFDRLFEYVITASHPRRPRGVDQAVQQLLLHQHRLSAAQGLAVPLTDTEAQFFSQNGEDGILIFLLAIIGITPERRCVELCAGDGLECNTANLLVNLGFEGLLVDGGDTLAATARDFYGTSLTTWFSPPTVVQQWVTAENVNQLCCDHGFAGEIDVLSLDVDGMEWWLWRALDAVAPQIVVVEYNSALGPERAVVAPYDAQFRRADVGAAAFHAGGSLRAFVALGQQKGYAYVGSERYGSTPFSCAPTSYARRSSRPIHATRSITGGHATAQRCSTATSTSSTGSTSPTHRERDIPSAGARRPGRRSVRIAELCRRP